MSYENQLLFYKETLWQLNKKTCFHYKVTELPVQFAPKNQQHTCAFSTVQKYFRF